MINYNFNNPLLRGMEEEKRRLGLDTNPVVEVPKLGSLSNLNNSLNVDSGITFNNLNQMPSMNSLNTSLDTYNPFGDQTANIIGQASAQGN